MVDCYINSTNLSDLAAYVLADYTVTSAPINRTVYAGGCASYVASKAKIGLKKIKIPLRVIKKTTQEAEAIKSYILSLCMSPETNLRLPNGCNYIVALTESGQAKKMREGVIDFMLSFTGYQRGNLVTAKTPTVMCFSTVPETPYKITGVVADAGEYQIAGVTIARCAVDDVIVIDGLAGKLSKNGDAILIADTNFVSFPALSPGQNTVVCTTPATVEYYPIYM